MSAHSLLSRAQPIISETDIPPCHEAKLFNTVSLGLPLPLYTELVVGTPSQHKEYSTGTSRPTRARTCNTVFFPEEAFHSSARTPLHLQGSYRGSMHTVLYP
ncbi:hypothetical protein BsWGS_27958 [Bradybaena similaris]